MGSRETDKPAKEAKDPAKETPTSQEQSSGNAMGAVPTDWTGFQVKTTKPNNYVALPTTGILVPYSTTDVSFTMQAQNEAPQDMKCNGLQYVKGQLQSYQLPKEKHKNETSLAGSLLAVSPVSLVMAPMGAAQSATKELLDSILDAIVRIFENHVVVGELIESKSSQQAHMNTPKSMVAEISGNPDSEASQAT